MNDIPRMCTHNAAAAAMLGRKDLVQVCVAGVKIIYVTIILGSDVMEMHVSTLDSLRHERRAIARA